MTKQNLFKTELQENAVIFKALAHPARLAILEYLAQTEVCISGDISHELPLSRTTVHQHLAELKNCGLIKGEITGVKTKYCLNKEGIMAAKEQVESFMNSLTTTTESSCKQLNCE